MAKLNDNELHTLKTAQEVRQAERAGQITAAQADRRYEEIEREDRESVYKVSIGKTGRFYVSGPDCSQSLHAGQVLGILASRDKIIAEAKRFATAKPRTEVLKNSKGEEYNVVMCGDINCGKNGQVLKTLAAL